MKFKIGDIVEIVGMNNSEGKVTEYGGGNNPFPYTVERKNGNTDQFNVKELKLIRKGN